MKALAKQEPNFLSKKKNKSPTTELLALKFFESAQLGFDRFAIDSCFNPLIMEPDCLIRGCKFHQLWRSYCLAIESVIVEEVRSLLDCANFLRLSPNQEIVINWEVEHRMARFSVCTRQQFTICTIGYCLYLLVLFLSSFSFCFQSTNSLKSVRKTLLANLV